MCSAVVMTKPTATVYYATSVGKGVSAVSFVYWNIVNGWKNFLEYNSKLFKILINITLPLVMYRKYFTPLYHSTKCKERLRLKCRRVEFEMRLT